MPDLPKCQHCGEPFTKTFKFTVHDLKLANFEGHEAWEFRTYCKSCHRPYEVIGYLKPIEEPGKPKT
jgi:5-methylcytosine-specific restriction endonuclease McrA